MKNNCIDNFLSISPLSANLSLISSQLYCRVMDESNTAAFMSRVIMGEITIRGEEEITFPVTPCAAENNGDFELQPGNWKNILTVEPCCRARAEVTVNGGKLVS